MRFGGPCSIDINLDELEDGCSTADEDGLEMECDGDEIEGTGDD